MPTANEILNFNFPHVALQEAAKTAFPETLIQLLELKISKLQKVTEHMGASVFKFNSGLQSPQIYRKFKSIISTSNFQLKSINNFDKKELKALSHCLDFADSNNSMSIMASPSHLKIALTTLENNWKDYFLFGLINCYLKNWESKQNESLKTLYEFISVKIKLYNGGRQVFNSFKENVRFFHIENGDAVLGSELAIKNKDIKNAAKFLLLPENWFTYPYFSKVIISYYEKRTKDLPIYINELTEAITNHSNNIQGTISNKRLVSKLIIQANTNDFAVLQDKVKSIAFKLVGDPGNAANWIAFENATEIEKEDLRKARIILNEWITRQFINVFFEKCINDSRRKRFWLKYAKEITQFRVVGSTYVRQLLMTDNRINEYVSPRFSKTNSSRDGNAALMFIMRQYLFVEFSDDGAFYVYKISNQLAPSIEKEFFYSTDDLKLTHYRQLIYRSGNTVNEVNEEGKLPHRDGDRSWEEVASYWVKEKLGINV